MIEEKTEAAKELEQAKDTQTNDKTPRMHIKIYSPFKIYFDEMGESLSGVNGTGPFDILPHHHNFMTLLSPCELVVRSRGSEQRIRISGGLMHVKADRVIVFLDV